MECADDEESSDDGVVFESTAAAIQAQLKPGRHKYPDWSTKSYNGAVEV